MIKTFCKFAPVTFKHISVCKMVKNEYSTLLAITPKSGTFIKFTQNIRLLSTDKTEDKIKITKLERVYEGPLRHRIRTVKWFSLSSSVMGILMQPFMYKEIASLDSAAITVTAYTFVGFFTVVTPLLLHLITKKYVTTVDYNHETGEYCATVYNFFGLSKEIKFKPEDVVAPDVPGMFTSIIVKNIPLFLDLNQFEDPNHYAKIMGYDKPMDFKLFENSEQDKKQ